jgi:hypothetical protein
VIIAVTVVRVMQVAIDEVVGVITVRDGLVAAATTVCGAATGVAFAVPLRRAPQRMSQVDSEHMLIDVTCVRVMHVAVVQEVGVVIVLHGHVTTVGAVLVRVVGVGRVLLCGSRHQSLLLRPPRRIFFAAADHHAVSPVGNGSTWMRFPVAAKMALATAGPTGATPGSPTPVGGSADGTMWTSTLGISFIRSTR